MGFFLAGLGLAIGATCGLRTTVVGLAVVDLVTVALVGTLAAGYGHGLWSVLGYMTLMLVTIQLGYGATVFAAGRPWNHPGRSRNQERRVVRRSRADDSSP